MPGKSKKSHKKISKKDGRQYNGRPSGSKNKAKNQIPIGPFTLLSPSNEQQNKVSKISHGELSPYKPPVESVYLPPISPRSPISSPDKEVSKFDLYEAQGIDSPGPGIDVEPEKFIMEEREREREREEDEFKRELLELLRDTKYGGKLRKTRRKSRKNKKSRKVFNKH